MTPVTCSFRISRNNWYFTTKIWSIIRLTCCFRFLSKWHCQFHSFGNVSRDIFIHPRCCVWPSNLVKIELSFSEGTLAVWLTRLPNNRLENNYCNVKKWVVVWILVANHVKSVLNWLFYTENAIQIVWKMLDNNS